MPNILILQLYGGVLLGLFLLFQLATGLRWIKLGRHHVKYHRRTGIVMAALAAGHVLLGFNIVYGFLPFP